MIADLLESDSVVGRLRARTPWMVVAASALLAVLLLYTLFSGYIPAKQRIARLEAELKELYAREAELQNKLAQQEQGRAIGERQLRTLTAERDLLSQRLQELERQLGAARRR